MTEATEEYKLTTKQSIAASLTTSGGLVPSNLEQLWQLSVIMAKSGLMPKGLATTEAVFVAVQMGLEVGLSPMQAVQNIAVINGRPSVWGDAGLALVEASGKLEDFKETITQDNGTITATCWAKRKGRPTPVERTFTTEDAKNAGLHGKAGPWKEYPKRMTQMRARWWVLRDLFADVLKGLKAAEEVQDYINVTPEPLSLTPEGEPAPDPYKVKEPPKGTPEKQEEPKAETSAPTETIDKATGEVISPEPQNGNGPTIVCNAKGGKPRVYVMKICKVCGMADECKDLAAYNQQAGETDVFLKKMDDAVQILGLPTVNRVLRTKFKAKDMKELKAEKRDEFLKALNEEADKANA